MLLQSHISANMMMPSILNMPDMPDHAIVTRNVIVPGMCHTLDFAVTVITNGSKPIHQARATELGGAAELRKR